MYRIDATRTTVAYEVDETLAGVDSTARGTTSGVAGDILVDTADPARSDDERRQALKFVVHLVGDVHQPLHAGRADDRGGNDYQINWRGKGSNLHSLWDSGLINAQGLDEEQWLARLHALPAPAVSPVPAGAARLWAEQSCKLANAPGFYPGGHVIGPDYAAAGLPLHGTILHFFHSACAKA